MDNHSSEEHQQQHITIEEPAHPLSTPERHQNRPRRSPSRESRLSFQSESDREFVRRVSFDKVPVDGSATHQGRTCSIHFVTKKYERSRRPRTFMVLVNADADETWAIEYTLQSLACNGDEVVVVGVSLPAVFQKVTAKEKAKELLESVVKLVRSVEVSVVVEVSLDQVEVVIDSMLELYSPSLVVVNSRSSSAMRHTFTAAGLFGPSLLRHNVPVSFVPFRPTHGRVESFPLSGRSASDPQPDVQEFFRRRRLIGNRTESLGNWFKRILYRIRNSHRFSV